MTEKKKPAPKKSKKETVPVEKEIAVIKVAKKPAYNYASAALGRMKEGKIAHLTATGFSITRAIIAAAIVTCERQGDKESSEIRVILDKKQGEGNRHYYQVTIPLVIE